MLDIELINVDLTKQTLEDGCIEKKPIVLEGVINSIHEKGYISEALKKAADFDILLSILEDEIHTVEVEEIMRKWKKQ